MVDQLPITPLLGPGDSVASGPTKPRLRGVSHQVAAWVFPLLGLAAVLAARSAGDRAALAVYTAGVTGMYATSVATTGVTGPLRPSAVCVASTTR